MAEGGQGRLYIASSGGKKRSELQLPTCTQLGQTQQGARRRGKRGYQIAAASIGGTQGSHIVVRRKASCLLCGGKSSPSLRDRCAVIEIEIEIK